jgi:hypothetical protein
MVNNVQYYEPAFCHLRLWNPTWNFSAPDLTFASAAAEAYLTMKPSLSSGFSLSNFIIELAELKILLKLWSKGRSIVEQFLSQSRTKQGAQGFLTWNFGVKLFIRDCITMYEKCTDMEKTLNAYKAKQGRSMTSHWKYTEPDERREYNAASGRYVSQINRKREYHATMRYTYVVPRIDQEYAKLRGLGDVLGLKANLSVVWEAIPFSFVVDWFMGVGNYLQALETDYLDSVVTIQDFCVSIKTIDTRTDRFNYANQSAVPLYDSTETTYERRRMLPDVSNFGIRESHRYGGQQMLLSTALLLA